VGPISLVAALLAGVLSFLNPCVLPLVPGFLAYLSGVCLADPRNRLKIFINSLFFVLGFSFVFAILGVLLNSALANISSALKIYLSRFGGAVIILFGCHLLGIIRIPVLEREHKIAIKGALKPSYFLSFIFGSVFAVGWTPCVGVLLAGVLALAATSPGESFILLMFYSLGLGIPFVAVGLFSSLAVKAISESARFFKYFNVITGVFVLILGVLIFTDRLSALAGPGALNIGAKTQPAAIITPEFPGDNISGIRRLMKENKFGRAKELISPDGFINTGPFELQGLVGKKVILLDFWTYSCINCLRTFPYLKDWYSRYKDMGLEIVGVHSPEFEFEKKYENVLAAVKKLGITFPIVLDNEHRNLSLYETVYWPTKYLIDIDGFIVYKHIGEGGYRETEQKIQELLAERENVLGKAMILAKKEAAIPEDAVDVDFSRIKTPEIYLGAQMTRGNFGNAEGLRYGELVEYELPASFKNNEVYIDGAWYNGPDYLELKSAKGRIVLVYQAKAVNIVAGAMEGSVSLKVKIDGEPVSASNRGRDVSEDGVVVVRAFDLYNIVANEEYEKHELQIEIEGSGFAAYAFTFG